MDSNLLQLVIKVRDEASDTLKQVGSTVNNVGNSLKEGFGKAAIVSGVALAGLTAEAVKSINAFQESELAVSQLEAVLKSTKGAAGITKDAALDLASSFEKVTMFSDEAVLGAESMLLTFTSIGKDVFPEATKTVLDMSQALGQDLKASSIQLGKALNDPITGVTALRRVGVQFNDTQQETIKKLVESGHLLDAQKMILKELSVEFGGSAEAAGKTFGGRLEQLKNTINNVEESLGGLLVKGLEPVINNVQMFVDNLMPFINGAESLDDMISRMEEDFGAFGVVIGQVAGFLATHKEVLIAVAGAIAGFLTIAIVGATIAMISFIGVSLPVIGIFMAVGAAIALLIAYWPQISGFFQNIGNVVSTTLTNISNWWNQTWTNITSFVQQAIDTLIQIFTFAFSLSIPFIIGFLIGFLMTAIPNVVNDVSSWFNQLPGRISAVWESVKTSTINKVTEMVGWLTSQLSALPGKIQSWISGIPGIASGIFESAKQAVINKMSEMFDGVKGWWDRIMGILNGIKDAANAAFDAVMRGLNAGKKVGSFAIGGFVPSTGLAMVHAGEFVLSRDMLAGNQRIPQEISRTFNQPITINAQISSETDIDLIGYRLAWYMRNSR